MPYDEKNDEELMIDAARGDMDAFEEIVRRYEHRAFNVAYRMLSDQHLAADVAQEAFLRVLNNAESYQPSARFSTYFFSILRRICIDHYRKKTPDDRSDFNFEENNNSTSPSDILMHDEEKQKIHDEINKLPARQRMALLLKHFENMSYKEIAEVMGCTASAVDSLLIRARGKLAKKLESL